MLSISEKFNEILAPYSSDASLPKLLLDGVISRYQNQFRHYHSWSHIEGLMEIFSEYQDKLTDPDLVFLAIIYHDVVYSATRSDNEIQSAHYAEKDLQQAGYPDERIELVKQFILQTQNHQLQENSSSDMAWFLDFDMSVLGVKNAAYDDYTLKIRKEFWMFPDVIYRNGRKKVLQDFLQRPSLFITDIFKEKYEDQARQNILREVDRMREL